MKKIFKYLITFLIASLMTFGIILAKNVFEAELKDVYKILIDAFFAVGCVIFCIGILIFSSNEGTFDMLGYGIRQLFNLFKKDVRDAKYRTFYEYRCAKREKNGTFAHFIIIGIIFISISLFLLIFYYNVK